MSYNTYPEYDHKSIIAVIRDNDTQEVREFFFNEPWYGDYIWKDGNFSCDCNRGHFFADAGGEEDPDQKCGHTKYTVIKVKFPDGTEELIDE